MKKLLVALLAFSSLSFAGQRLDCSKADEAKNIVNMMMSHKKSSLTLNYSQDMKAKADACKSNIEGASNNQIKVTLQEVSGSKILKKG
jgi:hypothetical protein